MTATFVIFLPKLSSFIDWCCYYTQVSYTGSSLVCKSSINCIIYFSLDELIILRGKISYLLGSNKDLQPFADQEAVDQSTLYTMPDLFPVDPTIDLIKEHIYTDTIDTGKVV